MQRTMRTSGAEPLCTDSTICVGLMESLLVIKPFIAKRTWSEIIAIMTAGVKAIFAGLLLSLLTAAFAGMLV